MDTYFKVDYHYSLENAFDQMKKLKEAGLRNTTVVCVTDECRTIYWVCVAQKNSI